jgi:hypothetical protein
MIPTALSHEVAGKIVLVQALHDRNDRARLLEAMPLETAERERATREPANDRTLADPEVIRRMLIP